MSCLKTCNGQKKQVTWLLDTITFVTVRHHVSAMLSAEVDLTSAGAVMHDQQIGYICCVEAGLIYKFA